MRILFFGELYPDVVHGVSIANKLNLNLLSNKADIDVVQERTNIHSVGKTSFSKVINLLRAIGSIFIKSRTVRYQAFYTVLSLSLFGILKTIFSVYSFSNAKDCHIVVHLHRGDFASFYQRKWLNRTLVKICFYRANRLIVLSEGQRIEMSQYFSESSVYVVENSVLEESEFSVENAIKKNDSSFVYISNYLKEKGIYDLLLAFNRLEGVTLNCYGAFYNNEVEIKGKALKNVNIHSVLTGANKYFALGSAEALILPSWNEGQPTVILEAMMVGTIILTTKVGLIGELLGEDYPFYFRSNDSNDLVDCVLRFQRYENKKVLSESLKALYFEKFSQSHHRQKILSVFGLEH